MTKAFSRRQFLASFAAAASMLIGAAASAETVISSLTSPESAAEIASRYDQVNTYSVTRNGKKIGTHTISFAQSGEELIVNVNSKIRVTVLRVPVYTLTYASEERWIDNTLISVTATTTENGDAKTVQLESPTTTKFSSNHWNNAVVHTDNVFNTLTGEISDVSIQPLGLEELATSAGSVSASRYEYTGDIDATVWYDDKGRWLKMSFDREDGSVIQYIRQ